MVQAWNAFLALVYSDREDTEMQERIVHELVDVAHDKADIPLAKHLIHGIQRGMAGQVGSSRFFVFLPTSRI